MNISIKRVQHDACIGAAEREKFGTQFKKTFRFLSMAALLVVGTIMTGCSNEDNIDNQQPANNDNVVTLTATVSLDGGTETRAITPSTGAKTFEATNKIAVIYKNTTGAGETVKAESGTLTLSADKPKATFTVTLTNPATNSAIRYIYPASMAKTTIATDATITDDDATIDYTGLLGSQNGDLTTLGTNYDLAVYDGSLSGTDLPASASLENPLAVCEFTFSNSGDITSSITSLTVSDGTNTYAVAPSGLSKIYVAMKPVSSSNIAFTAATGSKTYFKTATGKTLGKSKLYPISVTMTELAVGKVICSEGDIYDTKSAATTAGKTPVAMIAYLGNASDCANGLAIALEDVSSNTLTWDNSGGNNGGKTAAELCSAWNTSKAVTGGTWHLPSAKDWQYMFIGCGSGESYSDPTMGMTRSYSGLKDKLSAAGGTALETGIYWSSTELNPGVRAWYLDFDGSDAYFYRDVEYDGYYVRACLAF